MYNKAWLEKRLVRTTSDYRKDRTKLEWKNGTFTQLDSFFNQSSQELKYKEDDQQSAIDLSSLETSKTPSSPSPKS